MAGDAMYFIARGEVPDPGPASETSAQRRSAAAASRRRSLGQVECLVKGSVVALLDEGGFFGEWALLSGQAGDRRRSLARSLPPMLAARHPPLPPQARPGSERLTV
jgi:hypothetical protein